MKLLALRSKWQALLLSELGRMYRLHKWRDIAALMVTVLHWWWATGTKWMVGRGWLVRPARKPGGG